MNDYEKVHAWSHIEFDHAVPLVPRKDIRIGDLVQSSHGYRLYIEEVRHNGAKPHGGVGTVHFKGRIHAYENNIYRTEQYDADSRVPLLEREWDDDQCPLRQMTGLRCFRDVNHDGQHDWGGVYPDSKARIAAKQVRPAHADRDERVNKVTALIEELDRAVFAAQEAKADLVGVEECGTRSGWLPDILQGTAAVCRLPMGHDGAHQAGSPAPLGDTIVRQRIIGIGKDATYTSDAVSAEVAIEAALAAVIEHIDSLIANATKHTDEPNGRDGFIAALEILKGDLSA